jgi:O-antigen/teichoic acid export membrane protein
MLRQLIRDSAIYGGSDALARAVAFVTFPIIAKELGGKEFGILELGMTIVMLGGLFVRCGMNNAVQRYYWDAQTPVAQRPVLVSTGLAVTVACGLLVGSSIYLVHPALFRHAGVDPEVLGWYGAVGLALLITSTQWTQYVQDVLRLHFTPWKFLGFSVATRALAAILSAGVLVWLHAGVGGVLMAQALILLVSLPVGLWFIRRDLIRCVNSHWTRRLLAFGAPFTLTDMAFWLFSSIDRWMLASMISPQEVGVFSAAFRISALASFLSLAFGMAWSPCAVKLKSEYPAKFKQIYAEILILLIVVMLFAGGSIGFFSGELLAMLLPTEFADSASPLAILAFCVVVQASQQITAVGISLSLKSHLFVFLVLGAAIVNFLLNLLLIPITGAIGAAWATLIAHLILTGSYLFCSQYVYPISFPVTRLFYLTGVGAVMLICALMLHSNEVSFRLIAIKMVVLLACASLSWLAVRLRVLRQI